MKPIPDCIPDALTKILDAARAVSDDVFIHRKIILKVMSVLADSGDFGVDPSELYLTCWDVACRALGVKDPYEKEKARGNKAALGILKSLYERSSSDGDLLKASLKISYAGALTDFTGLGRSDIEEKVALYYSSRPARDESEKLAAELTRAAVVVLVADRAGEIALDRPLTEYLVSKGKKVFLAVAARPVFSLATEKDAVTAGFTLPVEVINPGTGMYGLMQERSSSQFREIMEKADVILAKGDTHFSTLTSENNIYYILRAGTPMVAARLAIPLGSGAICRDPENGHQPG
ncbi:MAG: ARMT1-like domain-containing protein [Planctomycetota bacterium]|jgi:uncharacterized protein with ATP-grasp and redox domains|nr:ARMT1-like domain-containing protein [Planctomycetota bacterium]